jgi:hypothetical protein
MLRGSKPTSADIASHRIWTSVGFSPARYRTRPPETSRPANDLLVATEALSKRPIAVLPEPVAPVIE